MNISADRTCCMIGWLFYWILDRLPPVVSAGEDTIGSDMAMSSVVHRQLRGLSFPEESEMGLFFALAIPLDDPVSTKAISVAFFFEANYQLPNPENERAEIEEEKKSDTREIRSIVARRRVIDRRAVYTMLESKFESIGFSGRACLLRSICDTTRRPLDPRNGVLGDLFRILFTPSSSVDEGLDEAYTNAENQVDNEDDCGTTYADCPFSIYDYITEQYE